jgi:hypothetical protein
MLLVHIPGKIAPFSHAGDPGMTLSTWIPAETYGRARKSLSDCRGIRLRGNVTCAQKKACSYVARSRAVSWVVQGTLPLQVKMSFL